MIAVTATDDGAEAREPDYDIYLIAADGSFQRAVAPSPAPEFDPVWAPAMR